MQKINNLLDKYQQIEPDDNELDWRGAAQNLSEWFGRNCYWLMHRYPPYKLEKAWDICQARNDHDLAHFLRIIKQL